MRKPKQTVGGAAAETLTLNHVPAPDLRAVYVDGTTLTPQTDGSGALLRFAFTRIETETLSETFPIAREDNRLRATAQPTFITNQRKVVEALILMRPDQAYKLSFAILKAVEVLPDEIKNKYDVPLGVLATNDPEQD